jgi:hypothetical protein
VFAESALDGGAVGVLELDADVAGIVDPERTVYRELEGEQERFHASAPQGQLLFDQGLSKRRGSFDLVFAADNQTRVLHGTFRPVGSAAGTGATSSSSGSTSDGDGNVDLSGCDASDESDQSSGCDGSSPESSSSSGCDGGGSPGGGSGCSGDAGGGCSGDAHAAVRPGPARRGPVWRRALTFFLPYLLVGGVVQVWRARLRHRRRRLTTRAASG